MSGSDLHDRVREGSEGCGLRLTTTEVDQIIRYLSHLERWNRTINLTALPLTNYPAPTLNRLIFEPLQSVACFPQGSFRWLDFGSGGGSPAIPLRIVLPAASLTMIESRSRKAAFLRDVVRTLDLSDVHVLWDRLQHLPDAVPGRSVDVVTVR